MGRRRRNNVYRHFMLQEESQTSTCLLCYKRLNTIHGSNLMNHLKFMHKLEYEQILALNRGKIPPIATPPRISPNSNDEDSNQSAAALLEVDVDKFFTLEISKGRARCDICQDSVEIKGANLILHLKQEHPKVLKTANDDSEEEEQDDNLYQEVVYLYDSDSKSPKNTRPSKLISSTPVSSQKKKLKQETRQINRQRISVENRKRRRTQDTATSPPADEFVEELDNFGKYVTCLMKTVPKDLCTQLQMDVINLIMTAKIKNMSKSESNNSVVTEKVNSASVDASYSQSVLVTPHDNRLTPDRALPSPESNVLEPQKSD